MCCCLSVVVVELGDAPLDVIVSVNISTLRTTPRSRIYSSHPAKPA